MSLLVSHILVSKVLQRKTSTGALVVMKWSSPSYPYNLETWDHYLTRSKQFSLVNLIRSSSRQMESPSLSMSMISWSPKLRSQPKVSPSLIDLRILSMWLMMTAPLSHWAQSRWHPLTRLERMRHSRDWRQVMPSALTTTYISEIHVWRRMLSSILEKKAFIITTSLIMQVRTFLRALGPCKRILLARPQYWEANCGQELIHSTTSIPKHSEAFTLATVAKLWMFLSNFEPENLLYFEITRCL